MEGGLGIVQPKEEGEVGAIAGIREKGRDNQGTEVKDSQRLKPNMH